MSFQLLDDFFRLQIPNINQIVFRAADDPFSSSDGKIGENAIFFIFVSAVSLDAFVL